jgi:tRNA dimethylallyltransferase
MPANSDSRTVLVIVGSTAVGKTDLAIELAQLINGEIISADSRLFYRGLDIGTAKPTIEQQKKIPHYLIDVSEPEEIWSLTIFQQKVAEAISLIHKKGKLAIIVGGTGQYIRAIIEGWQIPQQRPDEKLRIVLEQWGTKIGAEALHQKLELLDPVAADKIEVQNIRRTVRALEVILMTGRLFSEQRIKKIPDQEFWLIGLYRPRQEIYKRIDDRIETMFANGLIKETKELLYKGLPANHPNLSAIGYREVCKYLFGELTLEEAKVEMRKKTRNFVRRQANWFKPGDSTIHWYEMDGTQMEKIIHDLRIAKIIE